MNTFLRKNNFKCKASGVAKNAIKCNKVTITKKIELKSYKLLLFNSYSIISGPYSNIIIKSA